MILTTPNLEKHVNNILSVFKRNKNNIRSYELESLESVLKHIESSLKGNIKGFDLIESLVMLLMFHYTIHEGSPKSAIKVLRDDIRNGNDILLIKLHSVITNELRKTLFEEYKKEGASEERMNYVFDKIENEYTIEQVKESVKKTTHDLLTLSKSIRNEFF